MIYIHNRCINGAIGLFKVAKLKNNMFSTISFGDLQRKINTNNTIKISNFKNNYPLPGSNEENILVTAALPYVNNSPHIGNIVGCVLSADAFVRYCRSRGKNCLFISGTDEYGTATEIRSLQENVSCKELCDRYFLMHKKIYEWFEINFDYFGRTSTDKHADITQTLYTKIKNNGYILKQDIKQLFCEEHNRFLADRFAIGTCPICSFEDARGDQCDKCGHVFDSAINIINPRCKIDGSVPIVKNTKHLFLNLETLSDDIQMWAEKASENGNWTPNNISIMKSWFNVGLKPRCITRDLSWGVPVNEDGYRDKVFYVWFDACIGYPSITADYMGENWKKWWLNPDNVKLYQFMGKDNSSFHTIFFPSIQVGSGMNWTMLHHANTTEFLHYEGGKFSKSRGYGVFGDDLINLDISPSAWRYYLLSNRPEKSDVIFSWENFKNANNKELLGCFGNLSNRILKFIQVKFNSKIPEFLLDGPKEVEMILSVNKILNMYIRKFDEVKIKSATKLAINIALYGNKYLQECGLNNDLFENDIQKCKNVVGLAVNLIYLIAALLYPIIPSTSLNLYKQLNVSPRKIEDVWTCSDILPGHQISEPFHLVKKLSSADIDDLMNRFGSSKTSTNVSN